MPATDAHLVHLGAALLLLLPDTLYGTTDIDRYCSPNCHAGHEQVLPIL